MHNTSSAEKSTKLWDLQSLSFLELDPLPLDEVSGSVSRNVMYNTNGPVLQSLLGREQSGALTGHGPRVSNVLSGLQISALNTVLFYRGRVSWFLKWYNGVKFGDIWSQKFPYPPSHPDNFVSRIRAIFNRSFILSLNFPAIYVIYTWESFWIKEKFKMIIRIGHWWHLNPENLKGILIKRSQKSFRGNCCVIQEKM